MNNSITKFSILTMFFLFIATTISFAQENPSHPFNVIVKNADRKPNSGFIKGTRVNDKTKRRVWWKGKRNISIENNDIIHFTSIPDSDLSISSSMWDSIPTLTTYMSKKRNNPKDDIIEGTIYLVDINGKSKPAQNAIICDADSCTNEVFTDILGRFAIRIDTPNGSSNQKKLMIRFYRCKNLTNNNIVPPDIDLTITTTDKDRAKIDVYVNDQGKKKDGE